MTQTDNNSQVDARTWQAWIQENEAQDVRNVDFRDLKEDAFNLLLAEILKLQPCVMSGLEQISGFLDQCSRIFSVSSKGRGMT